MYNPIWLMFVACWLLVADVSPFVEELADCLYWQRIEDTKADVEPLPFVPAMCIASRESKSEGCNDIGSAAAAPNTLI